MDNHVEGDNTYWFERYKDVSSKLETANAEIELLRKGQPITRADLREEGRLKKELSDALLQVELLRDALNRCAIIGERGVVEIATEALVKTAGTEKRNDAGGSLGASHEEVGRAKAGPACVSCNEAKPDVRWRQGLIGGSDLCDSCSGMTSS